MNDIFLSYSHFQSEWVHRRLMPILRASGVALSVDSETFVAGEMLPTMMRTAISEASTVLVVFSNEYLQSENCKFEMQSALNRKQVDAAFRIVGVLRGHCNPPPPFSGFESQLNVDLRDDT